MMRVRRHVYALLDVSLVLGESMKGVFMHDIVRDFCRTKVDPTVLVEHQRAFVLLMLAAEPEHGWQASSEAGPLATFVRSALRFSMVEAIGDDGE